MGEEINVIGDKHALMIELLLLLVYSYISMYLAEQMAQRYKYAYPMLFAQQNIIVFLSIYLGHIPEIMKIILTNIGHNKMGTILCTCAIKKLT